MIQGRVVEGLQALIAATDFQKDARGTRYTPAEILHQPATWQSTYEICAGRRAELLQFLHRTNIDGGSPRPTVFLVGAGTSDYVGHAVAPLLRRMWGVEAWAVPSTDLLTNHDDYVFSDRPYLWISFSRSGDSSEGLAVIETALSKYPNVRHLLVTCNQQGRMAAACQGAPDKAFVLALDDSANDRGLAMTSSFTNMVIAGQYLANAFSPRKYDEQFSLLSRTGEMFLDRAQAIASSISHADFTKACFVGSGTLRAVAKESALKILELTAGKIQTMSESTLGLRHGPMSALDGNTLFVSFMSRDPRRRNYEFDLLEEIHEKHLGKLKVVVTPTSSARIDKVVDYALSLDAPDLADEYRAPVDVMLAQMLGLFCSLRLGLKPDNPSPSGAISRVVSHVNIYS